MTDAALFRLLPGGRGFIWWLMKHLFALSLLPLLVACSGEPDAAARVDDAPAAAASTDASLPVLADQLIDDGSILGEMLARVKSVETAEAIRPKVEAMADEYRALFTRMEAMESPSFSDMTAMMSRAPKLVETQRRVASEIQRINQDHPDAADVLRRVFGDLGQDSDLGQQ